jgi:hypothetical protein
MDALWVRQAGATCAVGSGVASEEDTVVSSAELVYAALLALPGGLLEAEE